MTQDTRIPVLSGGCQCGAIRYAAYAMPSEGYVCHCRMCQKAVGGPYLIVTPVALADFAWTRGTPKVYRSSSIAVRDFCGDCGTPLSYRSDGSGRISLTIASLDHPVLRPPTLQYDLDARIPWVEQLHELTARRDTGLKPEVEARLVNLQHPDHDTPADWRPPQGVSP